MGYQSNSHTPTHNFKYTQYESKGKLKRIIIRNGRAISLKYFPECNMRLSQLIAQKKGHMLLPLEEETFMLTSNVPKKGKAPNYLHLSPPTKIGENPTKT